VTGESVSGRFMAYGDSSHDQGSLGQVVGIRHVLIGLLSLDASQQGSAKSYRLQLRICGRSWSRKPAEAIHIPWLSQDSMRLCK
jgi:hypothetical protein